MTMKKRYFVFPVAFGILMTFMSVPALGQSNASDASQAAQINVAVPNVTEFPDQSSVAPAVTEPVPQAPPAPEPEPELAPKEARG